ncbi:hypothetical protein BPAE_0051g00200 [Botrytis paeoniae]|uniref:Cytochrome P450 alkane hydroxylase n=1 Tax=Botrytis paeoniae TaxID=278948 RepID=A0A4Z1FQX1_9HELO|nr:hypothetical protein BPAE_0051g00200 [Botrytis paeoniae]
MFDFLPTFVYVLPFILLVYVSSRLVSSRAARKIIEQHGCEPPPSYPQDEESELVKSRTDATKNGSLMDLYIEHFGLYGKTWEEHFLGAKIINTMEARNFQQVTALAFQDWGKASTTHSTPFFGKGIFFMNGAEWKHARELVRPTFSKTEVSDVEIIGKHVDRLIEMIPRDGSTIDLQLPLRKLFLDTATEFLMGQSIDSQLADDPNNSAEILAAFDASLAGVGKRRLLSRFKRFMHNFDKSWKEACRVVHSYIDVHVARALKETENSESKAGAMDADTKQPTRYILLLEMAKQIRDPVALRFQVLNVFIPARDTTAVMLSNTLFHLARNPNIWTQLRNDSLALGDRPLTFEVLKSLQLFKYVLFETLRYQGPSGRIYRTATRDTVLPTGGGPSGTSPIYVKKGTVVALNLWGLHHDQDIWGQDVNEFKPQRWFDPKKQFQWEFVPFLGGPRICPAQQQVLTQSIYLLVKLTREFIMIENRDPVEEYVGIVKALTESKNGVKVAFRV